MANRVGNEESLGKLSKVVESSDSLVKFGRFLRENVDIEAKKGECYIV